MPQKFDGRVVKINRAYMEKLREIKKATGTYIYQIIENLIDKEHEKVTKNDNTKSDNGQDTDTNGS